MDCNSMFGSTSYTLCTVAVCTTKRSQTLQYMWMTEGGIRSLAADDETTEHLPACMLLTELH